VFTIGINRAVDVLAEKKARGFQRPKANALKDLGDHPSGGGTIQVMSGRYGPYVKFGKVNATLPRDKDPQTLTVEEAVALTFEAPFAPFTLTAKADRIEVSATGAAVMDFKTGAIPTPKQIATGFAPQLTLTGAILAEAGLRDGPAIDPEELTYVRVTGRAKADEVAVRASGAEALSLSQAALAGLKARVARFDDPSEPYRSWVAPQFMGNFGGNYDQLARVWEWHVSGGGEGEDA
jgi:RecB family exonuclease